MNNSSSTTPVEDGSETGAGGTSTSHASTASRLRALAIDVAPALGYTLIYTTTHKLMIAVGVAVALGALILAKRLVDHQPPWRALAALALIAVGATLAAHSGDATNYFLPHIGIQIVTLTAWAVMLAVRLPPAGVMASLLLGERFDWRRCAVRRRAYTLASVALLAWPVAMLAVNIPLYLAGNVIGLGLMDVLNPILFPLASLAAWRIYAVATRGHTCTRPDRPALEADDTRRRTTRRNRRAGRHRQHSGGPVTFDPADARYARHVADHAPF